MKHLINNQFLAAQKAIINAKKIAIFMHENPDGDALGSSFGLFEFLKKLFPKKEIYVVCDIEHMQPHLARVFNVTKKFHIPSHDTLAIICDTSNMIRVYGENEQKKKYYTLCDSVIRFDHHPITDKIAKIDIIDNHVSSTCELVYTFLSF
jgi:phosphoesterase RecJ-like protein